MSKHPRQDKFLLSSDILLPWHGAPEEVVVYIHSFIDPGDTANLLKLLSVSKFYYRLLETSLTSVFDALLKVLKSRVTTKVAMSRVLEDKERRQNAIFLSEILSLRVLGKWIEYYRVYPFTDSFHTDTRMERFFVYNKERSTCTLLTEMDNFKIIVNMPENYADSVVLEELVQQSDQIDEQRRDTLLFFLRNQGDDGFRYFPEISHEILGIKAVYGNPTPHTPLRDLFYLLEPSDNQYTSILRPSWKNLYFHNFSLVI